jgi:acetolactate synthase-1/3 small subunit
MPPESPIERHTIAVIVDNEPGVLARVIGLFAGRGYNIESLTVAEVDREGALSRITLVTSGTKMVIEQIKAQLDRLVPIHRVRDLTEEGPHIERELALVKLLGTEAQRQESQGIAETWQARLIDSAADSAIYEITDTTEKVDAFINLMVPLGLAEVARTGVAAIASGKQVA